LLLTTSGLPEQRQERHVPPVRRRLARAFAHSQGRMISLHQPRQGLAGVSESRTKAAETSKRHREAAAAGAAASGGGGAD